MSNVPFADTFGIDPARIYRKHSPETRRIIGLGATAIDEAIECGDIPAPLPLTSHGTATGWMGITLIELQRQRLERAEARLAAAAANPRPSPRERRRLRRAKTAAKTKHK
jgi:hypothetical protein